MKRGILLILCVILLMLVSAAYGQTVTGWERKVYYEAIERLYSLPEGSPDEEGHRILREVAYQYGLTYGEINDILDRVWEEDLTDYEWDIIDELEDRLDMLAEGAPDEEYDRIYREIARKYGITVNILYDIEDRYWWGYY